MLGSFERIGVTILERAAKEDGAGGNGPVTKGAAAGATHVGEHLVRCRLRPEPEGERGLSGERERERRLKTFHIFPVKIQESHTVGRTEHRFFWGQHKDVKDVPTNRRTLLRPCASGGSICRSADLDSGRMDG